MNKTTLYGFVTATISKNNPLQTILELTLTDFQPNANKTGVPKSEAENILKSAVNMPVKIRLTRSGVKGHDDAYPLGVISSVWYDEDSESIKASAIVWRNEYPNEDEYLRKETAEGRPVGTSWEIYYRSEIIENGIKWLQDTVFAATCIVSDPAYGDRTLISSVAEEQKENAQMDEETQQKLDQLYADCNMLVDYIYQIYSKLYNEVYDESAEKNAKMALERLTELFTGYQETQKQKTEAESKVQVIQAELDSTKEKIVMDKLFEQRKAQLEQYTQLPENSYDTLTTITEDAFNLMLHGVKSVSTKDSTIKIPPSMGSDKKLTTKELAEKIRNKE